jgi:hypothetical protein
VDGFNLKICKPHHAAPLVFLCIDYAQKRHRQHNSPAVCCSQALRAALQHKRAVSSRVCCAGGMCRQVQFLARAKSQTNANEDSEAGFALCLPIF